MTKRIAFLSVPQFGTNIADFAYRFSNTIQGLASDAVVGLQLNHGVLGQLRRQLFGLLSSSPSNFVLALVDTLDESDENPAGTDEQKARQREARFQLTSWLDNIANDFSIIEDLRSETLENTADDPKVPPRPKSPCSSSARTSAKASSTRGRSTGSRRTRTRRAFRRATSPRRPSRAASWPGSTGLLRRSIWGPSFCQEGP